MTGDVHHINAAPSPTGEKEQNANRRLKKGAKTRRRDQKDLCPHAAGEDTFEHLDLPNQILATYDQHGHLKFSSGVAKKTQSTSSTPSQ